MKSKLRSFRLNNRDFARLEGLSHNLNCSKTDVLRLLIRVGSEYRVLTSIKDLKRKLTDLGGSI